MYTVPAIASASLACYKVGLISLNDFSVFSAGLSSKIAGVLASTLHPSPATSQCDAHQRPLFVTTTFSSSSACETLHASDDPPELPTEISLEPFDHIAKAQRELLASVGA